MSSYTVGRVKGRVRSLVDDPRASWCTDDFLIPLVQDLYEDSSSQLVSTQSSWDIGVVEVPGIQPGTPNLSAQQVAGGMLAQLTDQPLRIDWKPAGQAAAYYLLIPNYEVLPDIQPAQYMLGWEYRSDVIWLTPCTIEVDLRIRGEFDPPDLNEDASVLTSHPRIGLAVSYGVGSLIGVIRGNKGWETSYNAKYEEIMDDIMTELVRSEQGQIRRIGRQSGRGGRGRGLSIPTAS
ncbi:MAG TPA: hypothetical protein VMQ60_03250 [Acidobacteriaceae bacterium]|nr:hypothetical protein [Acidobacteriaceae bacterium]